MVLVFSGLLAALFLILGLLVWGVSRIFTRRLRLLRTLKWVLVSYLVFLPLSVFVGFPLLAAYLIAFSGTRPMDRELAIDPSSFGCSFEPVTFPSRDGLDLQGWWMPGQADQPLFVLGHGLFRDRKEVVERACRLNQLGYGTLVYDSRRHGASPGPAVSLGYLERLDVLGAYDFASRHESAGVVILGVSMSATASLLALPELREGVVAVIADSPFASLEETVERHVWLFLGLPSFPFVPVFDWYLGHLAGFAPGRLDTREAVRHDHGVPILLIYGGDDQRMPAETARAIFEAIPIPRKDLVFFPGAGHARAWNTDPQRYLQVIREFIDGRSVGSPARTAR